MKVNAVFVFFLSPEFGDYCIVHDASIDLAFNFLMGLNISSL